MEKSIEKPFRCLDSRPVTHSELLSFSINFQPIGSGNPNVWKVYCSGMFLLSDKDEEGETLSLGNKASSNPNYNPSKENNPPVSFFILGEYMELPTQEQIIDDLFKSKDRFELWKAQCIYNLSGEVVEGYKADEKGKIIKKKR